MKRALLLASVAIGSCAYAQPQNIIEKSIADQIRCADFKRNADGSWTSGPGAKIGDVDLAENTFVPHNGVVRGGLDVGTAVEQKCLGK